MRFDSAPAAPYMKKGCEVMERKYEVGDILIGNEDNHYGYTAKDVYVIVKKLLNPITHCGDDLQVRICNEDGSEIEEKWQVYNVESRYFDYAGVPAVVSLLDVLMGVDDNE